MENENLKDRIKEIMDSKHMNNKVFASETGINEGTLSLLLRGKTQPTLKHYEAIHTRFPDIAMEWLFDGKGPMYQNQGLAKTGADDSATSPQAAATAASSLSESAASLNNVAQGMTGSAVHPSTLFDQGGYNSGSASMNHEKNVVKILNNHQRKITEIRVFFDDQTWESFVPKK
jgi:transcriptional regulator with XRE-family HTH domain